MYYPGEQRNLEMEAATSFWNDDYTHTPGVRVPMMYHHAARSTYVRYTLAWDVHPAREGNRY